MHKIFYKAFLFYVVFTILITDINSLAQESLYSRLYGSDRYQTAVEVSKKGWDTSQYVVLARGDDFPDALCAGPLAKKYGAPILLTQTERLSSGVLDEISRLGTENIIIVGGPGAVSENTAAELALNGVKVERIYGSDRYETSVKIAEKLDNCSSIALATGSDFPDALSISAIASNLAMPILLTEKTSLPYSVNTYINRRQIDKTYVIGGPGVINERILSQVPGGERIYGSDRFETNTEVLKRFESAIRFEQVYLAVADGPKGDEFADALSGSVLAAKTSSPVVLVYKTLNPVLEGFIKPRMNSSTRVTALGGEAVVPQAVVDDLLNIDETSVSINIIDPPSAVRTGETKQITVETNPEGAAISAVSSNPAVVSVRVSGNTLTLNGLSQGNAVITVTASMEGHSTGAASIVLFPPVYNITKDKYYSSIQNAIDYSTPGDTIKISNGIYNEHLTITKSNIKLIGEDRDKTIIDASQDGNKTRAGIRIKDASGIEIKNMTVRNAGVNTTNEGGREPYGIYASNSDKNLLDNLSLLNNGEYEIYLYDGCDLNTIQNSIIDGKGTKQGYLSLDGIFLSGGTSGRSSMSTNNKIINNTIKNVVYGISLTACESTSLIGNIISTADSKSWQSTASTGILLSNSSYSTVDKNEIDGGQYGIRLTTLSSVSPYSYAGTPDCNNINMNYISSSQHGIKILGSGNTVSYNSVYDNQNGSGIWLADSATGTDVSGNILEENDVGIQIDNPYNEAHFNRIQDNDTAIVNATGSIFNATKNWWGDINPSYSGLTNIDYSPWLGYGDDIDASKPGFQLPSTMVWCTNDSLQEILSLASNGDSLYLSSGTYTLKSQLLINKNLIIYGDGKDDTVIKIDFNTSTMGESAGAILVNQGRTLNLSDLTIDGNGRKVMEAVSISGRGLINNIRIKNITYDTKMGTGIGLHSFGEATVTGSTFEKIAGAGIGAYDNSLGNIGGDRTGDANTFIGSGSGDYEQYALYVGGNIGNSKVTFKGNNVKDYSGTFNDGMWSSQGICMESGIITISGNSFYNSPDAVKIYSGAYVNNKIAEKTSGKEIEESLKDSNQSEGGSLGRVLIYSKNDDTLLYPLPELPVVPQTN